MATASSRRRAGLVALWRVWQTTRKAGSPGLGVLLPAVPRLVSARLRGAYRDLPLARLAGMALAAAYILSPIDLLPEIPLAVFGLIDDAVVAVWLAGALMEETLRFVQWERARTLA
ncbi:MAG: DUF1232 domain-containing protein [Sporichthyaceae bacterium]|nr:DUF1232 domain-containing protein [Sporichthyaceae bacterium]